MQTKTDMKKSHITKKLSYKLRNPSIFFIFKKKCSLTSDLFNFSRAEDDETSVIIAKPETQKE